MTNVCTAGLDVGFASLDYLQIFILGVIQGITELLPVSSTAHMRVVPALLGCKTPARRFQRPCSWRHWRRWSAISGAMYAK